MSSRLGAGRYVETHGPRTEVTTTVHDLTTSDGARVTGVLRVPTETGARARAVVTLMHPRQDVTHHGLVPYLLDAGYAVWTQGSRSPNNDLNLLHEQTLLDFAAGHLRLRQETFEQVFSLGHSGGATLAAFYVQQAARAPGERLADTPSGRPVPLAEAEMPLPDGVIFLAPHPGQGALLARVIDPSVTDEADPLSIDHGLDPFSPEHGFRPAPESSHYDAGFVAHYRAAQAARIARIDERAAELVARTATARADHKTGGSDAARRASLAPALVPVYRTDADLRNVDLSLDPNQRPYGSLHSRRPDLTNYGLVGFGRLSTAEAWMSTWSVNTTRADFASCAPEVTVPTLLLEFTGDQASFPADIARFGGLLGAEDLTVDAVDGTHFGGSLQGDGPLGYQLAADRIETWLRERVTG